MPHDEPLRGFATALCVLGQARTLANPTIYRSQWQHLLQPLRAQGSLAVFAVIAPTDNVTLVKWVYGFGTTTQLQSVRGRADQFQRYPTCMNLIAAEEKRTSTRFHWVVRTRPDLYFYAALPRLASLNATAVYTRMRCTRFVDQGGAFRLDMIPGENQEALTRSCRQLPMAPPLTWTARLAEAARGHRHHEAAPTRVMGCNCMQIQCFPTSYVLDDQFAFVPRAYAELYFSEPFEHPLPDVTIRSLTQCPPGWPLPHCVQAAHLKHANVPAQPTALPFSIARTLPGDIGSKRRIAPQLYVDGHIPEMDPAMATSLLGCNGVYL